jgi:DHA2 family lincomycin resistance protein-like MFS transporter
MQSNTSGQSAQPATGTSGSPNNKAHNPKLVIAVAAFAAFLATFNETYLNVAFAPIMDSLIVDISTVQWLATAYMLGAAVMVPVSAFAYRSLPTRPLFCSVVGLLLIGSIVGALAPNFAALLAGRVIQALGTGLLIPVGINITLDTAPRNRLGTYMGVMGAMTTLGPSSSVVIAGILLSFSEWPVLFWVFGALCAVCLLMGAVLLKTTAELTKPRLDAASVALIGLALVGILYGLSTAFTGELPLAAASVVAGALLLAFFVRRQGSLEKKGKSPLIDLSPLKVKPFRLGVVINMLSLMTMFAMNIVIPMFMQGVLEMPALSASLTLFPAIALCCVVSPWAGRVYDRHGGRVLLPVGFVLVGVFALLLALFINSSSVVVLALLYIPVICGSALIIGPVQSLALSHLAPQQNAHGVTVLSTGFQVAGCIGASLFTGVYAAVAASVTASAPLGAPYAQAAGTGFWAVALAVALVALLGLAASLAVGRYRAAQAESAAQLGALALSHIMKSDVYKLSPDDLVADALRLFVGKGISGAPVVDPQGTVCGFVSDGDVMRYLADQTPLFKTAYSFVLERGNDDFDKALGEVMRLRVGDIATKQVISIDIHTELGAACKVLVDHHLRKAPVLSEGKLVGIINRSNISRYSIEHYLA